MFWLPTIKTKSKVFSNFGDGKLPPIHPRDIAAVAVKALTSAGHEGKAYSLTGPESLSIADQIRILSEVIGRPIEYVLIPDEAARDGMLKSGMPPQLVNSLVEFGAMVRSGRAAQVLPIIEEVLGRKGLTFADWARENAAAFR
jgi:(4-alkanoyl-5-oxo-2,5-dihydrofuran-3-yl)methyl phosphate reductase